MNIEQLRALPETQPRSGVYFLWRGEELLYIGASKSINSRMYIHHTAKRYGNQGGGYKQLIPYDRATFLAAEPGIMRAMERDLIARHSPPYNVQGA